MSYTGYSGKPEDLHFFVLNNDLHVRFTCPRCSQSVTAFVSLLDLANGFELECHHPKCRKPGERYGYQLTMYPQWEQSVLGESDRPLHEDWEKSCHAPQFKPGDRVWYRSLLGEVVGVLSGCGMFTTGLRWKYLVDFFPKKVEGKQFTEIYEQHLTKAREGSY